MPTIKYIYETYIIYNIYFMQIETKNGYDELRKDAKVIANTLIKEFAGKLVTKAGIRNKFDLPYVRAVDTFKCLVVDYGFQEVKRNSLRVPLVPIE